MRISDWSSDVCSSDLYMSEAESCDHIVLMFAGRVVADASPESLEKNLENEVGHLMEFITSDPTNALGLVTSVFPEALAYGSRKIGRASCRERVCQYV